MNRLAKRIARNGLLAAVILGVVGLVFAGAVSLWMSAQAGHGAAGEAETSRALMYRLPLGMAGWGFLFVVAIESVRHLGRRRSASPVVEKAIDVPEPDPAELLLEQLLREVEAKQQLAATVPSPSAPAGENSPIHDSSSPG